jgi:hypothetical protein
MRVTHCPVNTAGIPWANVQALRDRGVDARLVVFNRNALHPEADIDLQRSGGLLSLRCGRSLLAIETFSGRARGFRVSIESAPGSS